MQKNTSYTESVNHAQEHYERHFLQSLMARWPRRGRSLLQLGCGHGAMLAHFWESGFDVTGMESCQESLREAKERMGDRADWHLGVYDHTPFDDNEFDYVAILHILEDKGQIEQEAILKEAMRLATRGVIIVVQNPWSLAHYNKKDAVTIFQLWRMLRRVRGYGSMTWGTALHGPKWTWKSSWKWPWHWTIVSKNAKGKPLFDIINRGYAYSPFGATLCIRLDLGRSHAVTPLLLRAHERARATTVQAYPPTVLGHEKGVQSSSPQNKNYVFDENI